MAVWKNTLSYLPSRLRLTGNAPVKRSNYRTRRIADLRKSRSTSARINLTSSALLDFSVIGTFAVCRRNRRRVFVLSLQHEWFARTPTCDDTRETAFDLYYKLAHAYAQISRVNMSSKPTSIEVSWCALPLLLVFISTHRMSMRSMRSRVLTSPDIDMCLLFHCAPAVYQQDDGFFFSFVLTFSSMGFVRGEDL